MHRLGKPAFTLIQLSSFTPAGWLKNQLRIQADGLSGHLQDFWPDVADSQWIGGCADPWERAPYWLDGYIPLAHLLRDPSMIGTARRYVDTIIQNQSVDGFICPPTITNRGRYDVWPVFLILKVLVQYEEITGDSRIEECVYRALRALDSHLDMHTLFDWGLMRWFECLIPLWWLYDRRPEEWMLRLGQKLAVQGFDWQGLFGDWPYKEPKKSWGFDNHVVNNAMAVKAGILMAQRTGYEADSAFSERMYQTLMEYHGMVTGVFTGDECLAGKSPVQGTELCAVVELMYSFEQLLLVTGDPVWADRLERVAYNALPAAFSPDMWTHQYDQQVNQPQCSKQNKPVFYTNNGEANLFGLEPHFGCCTANMGQGWPKLARHTFLKDGETFVSAVLAPGRIDTMYHGVKVVIELITDYPFAEELVYVISAAQPVEFSLKIRIPAWAQGACVRWNGKDEYPASGAFYSIRSLWNGETKITVHLPAKPRLEVRSNGLFAVTRGPLVYAMPVKERWVQTNTALPYREFPHCDYEVYPMSDWNYGLAIDESDLQAISFERRPLDERPFSPECAPIIARVPAKKVAWAMEDGVCAPVPDVSQMSSETEKIDLIPYGCTNLRITEMPSVK